ncbi:Aep2p [Kluyveromyces lactis]|uniref:ATPase expression protein 2, mitochondrial n=1 Tax=Kluyveromyces lactis (strain ATCC 8585 / CBS 2359 / DSM 70799 / NBRC 1267 / NRRL Y-1140 / WM37) TaxID=284590 RepID=AEP2_KLULA|nr:uncharacterized protein KLLA0_D01408g [Kluyveromyces lactis]Q6CSF8.1 RecName: Full=ATPase expression protein 2, mitochondrial; Flags: Precursor [Kluyveromyces lactis NRRL Y-1140]CAH00227.1 KLLA0D01408p [Kluyveromyces lactis]|eukprot:XP_453131.1 uncharacterized protein KLLA0_D01408g [Kluyveromyces lactis]
MLKKSRVLGKIPIPYLIKGSSCFYSTVVTSAPITLEDSLQSILSDIQDGSNIVTPNKPNTNLLTSKQPIKALKHLQWKTNLRVKKTTRLLKYSNEKLTPEDYSVFVNQLMDVYSKDIELLNKTEVWKSLYHIYRVFVVNAVDDGNAMVLYDLNQFVRMFINLNDLPLARNVFQLILKNSKNGEIPKDVQTICMYLRLYCGALSELWTTQTSRNFYQDLIGSLSGSNASSIRIPSHIAYPTIGVPQFQLLLRKLVEDPEYSKLRNTEMDSLIIQALGHYKEVPFLKQYISIFYGIDENVTITETHPGIKKLTPDSQLLKSVISAYGHNNNITSGMTVIGSFMEKYPEMNLDKSFWRTTIYWSLREWNKYKDSKGSQPKKAWNLMLNWYATIGKAVPFDQKIMLYRLSFLKSRKDHNAAIRDVQQVFKRIFIKTEKNTFIVERLVLYAYQRFIIKNLVNQNENAKCVDFINEWRIDFENGRYLERYFKELTHPKNESDEQKKLNDEDDDYNFPLFGTNIL